MKSISKKIYVPFIIVVILMLLVWPAKLIGHTDYTHETLEKAVVFSSQLTKAAPYTGSFVPSGEKLKSIGIYTYTNNTTSGNLIFNLYDNNKNLIYTETKAIYECDNNDYTYFDVNIKADTSVIYTYEIYGEDCDDGIPTVGLTWEDALLDEAIDSNAIISLCYEDKFSASTVIPYWITLLGLGILITLAIKSKAKNDNLVKTFLTSLMAAMILILSIAATSEESEPVIQTGATLTATNASREYNSYVATSESYNYSGYFCYTYKWSLNRGSYTIGIEYTADYEGNRVDVFANGVCVQSVPISVDSRYMEFEYTTDKDIEEFQVEVYFNGSGNMTVSSVEVTPATQFSSDTQYFCVVVAGLFIASWTIAFYYIAKKKKSKNLPTQAALVMLSIYAFLPCCYGYLLQMDDLAYHLVRIEGIKDGLRSGQFPVVIYPEGMSGYGYLNCMYPNLFLYIPAILRLVGVSISTSYKTLVFLSHLASAYITYFSVKAIAENLNEKTKLYASKVGMLASVTYTICPYRLTNFYARGAVGESLAMTFFPLLIAGLFLVLQGDLNKAKKSVWMIVVGFSGLLQTHILSSVLALIICVIYGILVIERLFREKRILLVLRAIVWTLLINLWFIVPFVYFYLKGNLATSGLGWAYYTEYSLNLAGLAGTINTETYRSLVLGVAILLLGGIAVFTIVEMAQKVETRKSVSFHFLIALTIAGILCTYMVTSYFPAWTLMEISAFNWLFSNLQFAWRMLAQASLFLILAGALCLYSSEKLEKLAPMFFVVIIAISLLAGTRYTSENNSYEDNSTMEDTTIAHSNKLIAIPKSDATIVYPYEWRPDGLDATSHEVSVSDENYICVSNYTRTGIASTFTAVCGTKDGYVELPLAYYPGYKAYDENGNELQVEASDNARVMVYLDSDDSLHSYTVKYEGFWWMTVSAIVSFVGVVGGLVCKI